ncbi:Hypothetical predicted protein [Olea europaea subsp. europaea]|uniref:Uncharacterized protein n=1 Tax=Olea europaea subsp. europaea TaxID=158383 RepID=A0A8S0RKA2_OLEEU|nr:Hypothetical predicted protein [Olea europaea subsp. europaea]
MVTVRGGWHLAAVRGYGGFYSREKAWDLVFSGDEDLAEPDLTNITIQISESD